MIDTTKKFRKQLAIFGIHLFSVLLLNNIDAQIMFDLLNSRCPNDNRCFMVKQMTVGT